MPLGALEALRLVDPAHLTLKNGLKRQKTWRFSRDLELFMALGPKKQWKRHDFWASSPVVVAVRLVSGLHREVGEVEDRGRPPKT